MSHVQAHKQPTSNKDLFEGIFENETHETAVSDIFLIWIVEKSDIVPCLCTIYTYNSTTAQYLGILLY